MKKGLDFVEAQWRSTKRYFLFFLFWIVLITAINILSDARDGVPFDPTHILYAIGFMMFAGVLYLFSKPIFWLVGGFVRHNEQDR